MINEISLSIHQLVDFLLRRGSIDTRIYNADTMQEGTRIHANYQSIQSGNYFSEVLLKCDIEYDDFVFHLQGRADGIIKNEDGYIIDEIKSTTDDLEHFFLEQGEWHLGQAICYGYIYALDNNLDEIGIRLTYISQLDRSKLIKNFIFSFEQLKQKVYSYIEEYIKFYRIIFEHKKLRNDSASSLEFPFESFRKGQREVAKYVYKVSKDGGLFFFEAPTGTGKTMSTLFPSVKTFADNQNEKIFYLSAKVQAKTVAHEAMRLLVKKGLVAHSIVLSSKESMCQCENQKCNPDDCPFAKNYYEKINDVISRILINEKCMDQDILLKYALLNGICPFEFQLDVSTYCDVIICDYNYLFDPIVYLKRFFEENKTSYFALIDEAHNLSERTKDMFTISIEKEKLINLQKSIRHFKMAGLKRSIKKVLLQLDELITESDAHVIYENDFPRTFYKSLDTLFTSIQEVLKEQSELVNDEIMDVFKMVNRFNKLHDYLDDYFITYVEYLNGSINAYIRCLDSSSLIKDTLTKLRGAIMFSATLTPIEYYIETLGGDENTPYLRLPSPFDQNNLCLLVRSDISTKYKDRDLSYNDIALSIKEVVSSKIGNYLVFFSSYQYMTAVLNKYKVTNETIVVQDAKMKIKDREEFLSNFVENPCSTTVGFAVLGGAFSEGIDLVSSRLIGAIIVGVGLPMVSFERDLIKEYYNKKELNGFDYAYTNPGKNKVMQASGRVIRSNTDRGVVLLIDQRFMSPNYRDLFKLEWSHYKRVKSLHEIKHHLQMFWNEDNIS